MNYLEWNNKLAAHFFCKGAGDKVFLCVTAETLREVSGLELQAAKRSFVRAIKQGPPWTDIAGCKTVPSKAHNCLHPLPNWQQYSRTDEREKRTLTGHVHWSEFRDSSFEYPPYVAYLCLLVLSWTERPDNMDGGKFYEPLNEMLGLSGDDQIRSGHFGERYSVGENKYSINSLWIDLQAWSRDFGRGVCYLPDQKKFKDSYEEIPKFFGLMKARELRKLDVLFFELEERGILDPGVVPRPTGFVDRVLEYERVGSLGSVFLKETIAKLRGEGGTQDAAAQREVYGRLLQAKYLVFDGLVDEAAHGKAGTLPRASARILRLLSSDGRMRYVCCLRSEGAWEKLPLDESRTYDFIDRAGDTISSAKWIPQTPWFEPMDIPEEAAKNSTHLICERIGLKALISPKRFVVMRNSGVFALADYKVEVDCVERGRTYLLLQRGEQQPEFPGIKCRLLNRAKPSGMSCWEFSVPMNASAENWPAELPALIEEKTRQVRLNVSGFRLDKGKDTFPSGLPVWLNPDRDGIELTVVSSEIPEDRYTCKKNGDVWELQVSQEGDVEILCAAGHGVSEALDPCKRTLSFEDLTSPQASGRLLFKDNNDEFRDDEEVPYPEALILLENGSEYPGRSQHSSYWQYFVSAPPKVSIVTSNLRGHELRIERKLSDGSFKLVDSKGNLSALNGPGEFRLSIVCYGFVYAQATISLLPDPKVRVESNASPDKRSPNKIVSALVATLYVDDDELVLPVTWGVYDAGVRVAGGKGEIGRPVKGQMGGKFLDDDLVRLVSGRTYEIRFEVEPRTTISRWFKVEKSPSQRRMGFSLNPMAQAFDKFSPSSNSKELAR
jgi:hypothetical protein